MKMVAFLALLLSLWAIAVVAWMMLRYTPAGGDAQYVFLWDRWELVSARAPRASPNRVISAKPRAISAARAFCPSSAPSTTPQPIASTFLTAPPISAPITSSDA